jgi:hypothetical protein
MGEHAVMRFLIFKESKSGEMVSEREAGSGPDTLALGRATLKKWNKRFREVRKDLLDNPRCE